MSLLQRLHHFFAQPVADPGMARIYTACVQQTRRPEFYQSLGVPDTIDGRFDLLLLHVFLVMERLQSEPQMKQELFDLMFADMDRSLREMGVGDMSVGKKIRPMISAFYGRGQAYQKALSGDDALLAATLKRNLYGASEAGTEKVGQMTGYVRKLVAYLHEQNTTALIGGDIDFVPPPVATQIR